MLHLIGLVRLEHLGEKENSTNLAYCASTLQILLPLHIVRPIVRRKLSTMAEIVNNSANALAMNGDRLVADGAPTDGTGRLSSAESQSFESMIFTYI